MPLGQSSSALCKLAFAEALSPCLTHTSRPADHSYPISALSHSLPKPLVLSCLPKCVFPSTWEAFQYLIWLENFYTAFKALANGISSRRPSQTSRPLGAQRTFFNYSEECLSSSGLWLPPRGQEEEVPTRPGPGVLPPLNSPASCPLWCPCHKRLGELCPPVDTDGTSFSRWHPSLAAPGAWGRGDGLRGPAVMLQPPQPGQ